MRAAPSRAAGADNDGSAIWIAEGTYRPTRQSVADIPHSEMFQLLDGVALYGGFADSAGMSDWLREFEHAGRGPSDRDSSAGVAGELPAVRLI